MTSGSYGGRIGLVWESSRFIRDKRTYVARVVQKGTALKTPGPSLAASVPELIGVVVLVLWIPIRDRLPRCHLISAGVSPFGSIRIESTMARNSTRSSGGEPGDRPDAIIRRVPSTSRIQNSSR